ncbi:MAG: polymerase subunit chi [Steroidobacteraceae bacterium]|jgi:DNA polymerase-3 subunit chi|nr:polymerase subunit chi [Steroidobacteraceae bacterium]
MSPRVDFYLSEDAGDGARLRLACRVTEKAYLARQRVVIYSDDGALLPKIDELLWTFGDGSFVPHDTVVSGKPCEAPVALTSGPLPEGYFVGSEGTVLINLSGSVPPFFEKFARVAEFLDARPEVRAAGRDRFKVYRGKSIEPQTHNV